MQVSVEMVISVYWLIRPQDEKEKFVQKEKAWEAKDPREHTDNHLSKVWKRTETVNLRDQLGRLNRDWFYCFLALLSTQHGKAWAHTSSWLSSAHLR